MSVSILIPAFRPTFLRQAIASALTQTVDDFELIVSDDSGGEEILPVVERFRDPRIRYVRTSGRTGSTANCAALWNEAKHDLLAYLLDDDLLMPHALAELLPLVDRCPEASFYFGFRMIVDASGRVIAEPPSPSGDVDAMDPSTLSGASVGQIRNPIGEFSNILINRRCGVTADAFIRYAGIDTPVCGDMSFYLNASLLGPVVGIKRTVAAFRRHGDQNSFASFNPLLAMGICEWELFLRGEWDAGRLTQEQAVTAADKLLTGYADWGRKHPDIAMMTPGLITLRGQIAAGERGVLDAAFRQRWANFAAALQARKTSQA